MDRMLVQPQQTQVVGSAGSQEALKIATDELGASQEKIESEVKNTDVPTEISDEYKTKLFEYSICALQPDIQRVFNNLDPNKMIQQKVGPVLDGAIDFLGGKGSLGTEVSAKATGEAQVNNLYGSMNLNENLSFYTGRYDDAGTFYHGVTLNPTENISISANYSPKDRYVSISGNLDNFSAGIGFDKKSLSDISVEYETKKGDVKFSLTVTPSENKAEFTGTFTFL